MKIASLAALCIAGAAINVGATFYTRAEINENPAPATRAAISALYVASDVAQRAVVEVACGVPAPFGPLTFEDARQVKHVIYALHVAYDASFGTDMDLEQVESDFCAWAMER